MWGFSFKKSKKAIYVVVCKDDSCDFYKDDFDYLHSLTAEFENAECISEGLYRFPLNSNIESVLTNAGFTKDVYRSKEVLNYYIESRR